MTSEFENELGKLLNKHSIDSDCSTPDFILAHLIVNFILGLGETMKGREEWFGRKI